MRVLLLEKHLLHLRAGERHKHQEHKVVPLLLLLGPLDSRVPTKTKKRVTELANGQLSGLEKGNAQKLMMDTVQMKEHLEASPTRYNCSGVVVKPHNYLTLSSGKAKIDR